MFAAIWSDTLHAYDNPRSWQTVRQGQMIQQWCKLCPNVFLYNYQYVMLASGGTPVPLARKYRRGFPSLMRDCVQAPEPGRAKTWVLKGQDSRGWYGELPLRRLITSHKGQFRWRNPEKNPYLIHDENRKLFESRYADVAFAMSNT